MGNDFENESHGYIARIEKNINIDNGFVRQKGREKKEQEGEEKEQRERGSH